MPVAVIITKLAVGSNMSKSKTILLQSMAMFIFLLFAVVIWLYNNGFYDISFIERTESKAPVTEGDTLTNIDTTESDMEIGSGDGDSADFSSSLLYAEEVNKFPIASELSDDGYFISDDDYNSNNFKLAIVLDTVQLPSTYKKNYPASVVLGNAVMYPYMGYIIMNVDSGYILDYRGNVVARGTSGFLPVYQRDAEGNPLFAYEDGYYILSDDKDKMYRVNFDPAFGTALSFSYTSDYSEESIELYRFYVDTQETRKISVEDGSDITDLIEIGYEINGEEYDVPEYTLHLKDVRLWGYVDKDGEEIIEAKYYFASEFNSDGYAFVTRRDGSMIMINQDGKHVMDPYGNVMYLQSQDRHYIVDGYYLPDSFGSESIGMFRFDDGLLRVVRKFYDYYQRNIVVSEEDILIYRDNSKFAIPYGYELKGYSNGILLLYKNGRYGYMDNTGRWLVQPEYPYARPFFEGLAVITDKNGKKFMIDTDGCVVLPAVYDHISDCSDGVITAYECNYGWSIYNKMKSES